MPTKSSNKKGGRAKAKTRKTVKTKPKSEYAKATAHRVSNGRKVASKKQIDNKTPYKPRKNKAGHYSVMVGTKYGDRSGRDPYGKAGREYHSKYRGGKVGYMDDVPRGDY